MPKFDTGRFTLNYIEEGEGFPLVLIHGLAGDHRAWLPQIAAFKERQANLATLAPRYIGPCPDRAHIEIAAYLHDNFLSVR